MASGRARAALRFASRPEAVPDGHLEAHRALTRGGVAFISSSVLTTLSGLGYWLIAAHMMSRSDLGRGSSLLSALLTVSAIAQLNYARALPGLLPRARTDARRMLAVAYARVICASLILGLGFALIAPRVDRQFHYVLSFPFFAILFAIAVPLLSLFTLEDAVLATVRRSVIVPFENASFGILKLLLLPALVVIGMRPLSFLIAISWVTPLIIIVVPLNIYLFARAVPQAAATFPSSMPKEGTWVRYDFAGYLFWLLGTLPLPVLTITILGPTRSAAFYVPFSIATAIEVMILNLGNTLTSEMSRTRGRFSPPTAIFVWRIWVLLGLLSICLIAIAPYVLALFGSQYEAAGTSIFRVLMVAIVPRSVLFFCIAATRARTAAGRGRNSGVIILVLQAVTCLGTLGFGLIAMRSMGSLGMALGFTLASTLAAAIAVFYVRPPSFRSAFRPDVSHESTAAETGP